ncbi:MAG: BRCT domain-containing protein [bacterium]
MDITGKTIVLTGKFSQIDRKEAERLLTDMGARCSSSVSAKTDILFAGEKAGSKLAAATKLGVAVFGESDLMVVLGLAAAAEVEVEDADVRELLSQGKAAWLSNTPHSTDVVTFGMSHSGEYFATGAWCGDDYDAGGSLAIWETATGRCVNVYPRIQGGAGWPDYGGCIQWSHDDLRVGLAFDTNGVGYVDPFGNTPEVQNFVYATDGLSRPPGWCWAPDSARVFVSCWGWRESSLAGAIGAPSAYGSKPVYMEKTGQEESDADALQPFVSMVWSDDGRVVGYSRHGDVYAIDTTSRKLVWQTKIAGPVAICPDGSLVACHDRGLKWLDGKTGEVVAEPKFVGGGDLVFSADGQFLLDVCHAENKNHVTPCVRVYKGFELISVLDCEPAVSDSWRLENVQAKMSLDGTLVAVICADGVLRVFTVADEKEVFSMPAQGATDVFFAADNRIVLASDERLAFVQPSGELLIAHALKEFPAEDPLTEKLPGSNLCAFVNGERWGYATGALVVAGSDPENLVQAVVGRRRAYPPSVVGATIYPSLADAVAAHPKAFAKPVRDLVQKAKPSKAKASKFPPPNTHAARDVEDYLLAQLRDQDLKLQLRL